MFSNYLKIAWRSLRKNKVFSFINIAGLSLGISVCFIITLYVRDELSYERYNVNADRIARIQFKAVMGGSQISEAGVMAPVAKTLKSDYPEVENATRLLSLGKSKVVYEGKEFRNDLLALVDSNFFDVFTLPLSQGDAKTALSQPHTIVLSRAVAEKYFGQQDPIGRMLAINDDNVPYKVTGIFAGMPSNSDFRFDMLGSMAGFPPAQSDSWLDGSYRTYVLLKPGNSLAALEAKFPEMVKRYMGPQIQRYMHMSLDQFVGRGNQLGFVLQPLTAIHLHPIATTNDAGASDGFAPPGDASYVYIFGAIAGFMLLIACINFVNLSTAGASKRAREVGVRKAIGSDRSQLIAQFITESAVVVFVALTLSCALIYFSLPVFNAISGKALSFTLSPGILAMLAIFGLIVVVAAGAYPAFFMSSFSPVRVLKGKLTSNNTSFGLRSGLVVFQFVISVSLVIGTIVVYGQMRYIQNKELGYVKEQVLTIPNSYALTKNEVLFKNIMLKDPRVVSATMSRYKPAGTSGSNNSLVFPEGHDNATVRMDGYHVDEEYIPTLGMKMAKGRDFSREMATDSSAMILNETAVKALGFNENNVIGQRVVMINSDRGTNFSYHVIGVVKDFNFRSLHDPITPLLMVLEPESGLIFKVRTAGVRGLLADMKSLWNKFGPDQPFSYEFLDALYNKTYVTEEKTGTILGIFAALTILVACLGLFGLVTYTAEQRVKEIGIRKVLGASVTQITRMLSADFLKLVLIACLIALPISWWGASKWLQSFAYRMPLEWWMFTMAAASALVIALITLSFQAIRSATANPIANLRTE